MTEETKAEPSVTAPASESTEGASISSKAKQLSPDEILDQAQALTTSGKLSQEEASHVKFLLKDHKALKEKVDKLKSLLGRSAKAQRETKVDLEASQKRLQQALREIERLNQKLDKLQNRPSHLDLLMDFESNFDKALLSVGQSGGEDTAPTPAVPQASIEKETALDNMLMQELGEARVRIDKLESLNSALSNRSHILEKNVKDLQQERDEARERNDRLQMEVKMAKMEAEQAAREMQDKLASLEEMQMEIELVTKANAKANVRAAKGEEAASHLKTDRQKVVQLEAQVQALQEWALASAHAKQLAQERVQMLESKLRDRNAAVNEVDDREKILFTRNGSLVIGAGDKGIVVVELGDHAPNVDTRFVVLRWRFDFTPPDLTIEFNILKGECKSLSAQKKADYLVKDRVITGGAGGETEGSFNVDAACTLIWSNEKSWIRPRTVKYSVEVVSLK